MKKPSFEIHVAVVGALVGCAVSALFFAYPEWSHNLEKYQTFVAGFFALMGAAGTVWIISKQIRHAQHIEDERRNRRMQAARAMLPHALADLSVYSMQCASMLRSFLNTDGPPEAHDRIQIGHTQDAPNVMSETLGTIRECIEFSDEDVRKFLTRLARKLQIQKSRLTNPREISENDTISGYWFCILLTDAFEIYARCSMLYDYARERTDQAPSELTIDYMDNAANIFHFREDEWPELRECVRERVEGLN